MDPSHIPMVHICLFDYVWVYSFPVSIQIFEAKAWTNMRSKKSGKRGKLGKLFENEFYSGMMLKLFKHRRTSFLFKIELFP